MPQHRFEKFAIGDGQSASRSRPFDFAREGFAGVPGENHVAALQNMIYARFAASDEEVASELSDDDEQLEKMIGVVSRVAGIVAMVAALAAVAVFIF